MAPEIFDSEDPKLPKLPTSDQVVWSDYDLTDEDDGDDSDENRHNDDDRLSARHGKLSFSKIPSRVSRKDSVLSNVLGGLFGPQRKASQGSIKPNSDLESQKYHIHAQGGDDDAASLNVGDVQFIGEDKVENSSVTGKEYASDMKQHNAPLQSILNQQDIKAAQERHDVETHSDKEGKDSDYNDADHEETGNPNASARKRRRHKRNRKARKYTGSKSKKERVGWEPGIDIETTSVVLNSPGSRITITDYSQKRYRVTRYNLYSEMNPKYNKYSTDYEKGKLIPDGLFDDLESDLKNEDLDDDNVSNTSSYRHRHDREFNMFVEYMDKVAKSRAEVEAAIKNRPQWSKVRWVSITGISWEAITILGKHYELHPLAIEDMIDIPQRTKMDVYKTHLFVVVPLIKLIKTKMRRQTESLYTMACRKLELDETLWLPRKSEEKKLPQYSFGGHLKPRTIANRDELAKELDNISMKSNATDNKPNENDEFVNSIESATTLRSLTDLKFANSLSSKSKKRLKSIQNYRPMTAKSLMVGTEQLSMYLTKDNSILTFFEHEAPEIEHAILSRLSTEYTILRESSDPSILFHSILDATSDLLYPVIDAYLRIINEKELEILTSYVPDVRHTQSLHLMSNELTHLKSTILPIASLIAQLQTQAVDSNFLFIKEVAKIYMNDISDHLLSFIDDINGMSSTIENLINLVFNTISVSTNNSMQQLSIVTVLFLPLTFWAGYFGMNFQSFGELEFNVSFYWKVAIPFTAGLMFLVMYRSVWRMGIVFRNLFSMLVRPGKTFYKRKDKERNRTKKIDDARKEQLNWKRFKSAQLRQRKRPITN